MTLREKVERLPDASLTSSSPITKPNLPGLVSRQAVLALIPGHPDELAAVILARITEQP